MFPPLARHRIEGLSHHEPYGEIPGVGAWLARRAGRVHREGGRFTDDRIQSRYPADPLRKLLRLPRSRRSQAQGEPPARHRDRGKRPIDGTDSLAVVPGKPDESEMLARVSAEDADLVMPPPKTDKKLTAEQIDVLKRWIESGAAWEPHWSLAPVKRRESARH